MNELPPQISPDSGSGKRAVALGYDPANDQAPHVLASGRGRIAEQIIAIAKLNAIPIQDDVVLADALSRVELDQNIPPELYAVVAEVLAFVYKLKNKRVER
jgi:flagellar biosynthesis protein